LSIAVRVSAGEWWALREPADAGCQHPCGVGRQRCAGAGQARQHGRKKMTKSLVLTRCRRPLRRC